jgi:putative ABC transport system permease protein
VTIVQEARRHLRSLLRTPGFTLTAVLTLMLAIAVNTTIASIFDTVLLQPLPYQNSERLNVIHEVLPGVAPVAPVNAMHFSEWQRATPSFESMALIAPVAYNMTGAGEPARINAARVSTNLFRMLGVRPLVGRDFTNLEDDPGAASEVMLGYDLWTTRFGRDAGVLGRSVLLDDSPHTVVGVLPAEFKLPKLSLFYGMTMLADRPQLWKPFVPRPVEFTLTGPFDFIALARLKPGATVSQATSELNVIQANLGRESSLRREFRALVVPLAQQLTDRARFGLQVILGVVALVLLVACVNITNLLLTRNIARQREFAIRRAIGAGSGQLVRGLLIESLILSTAAGILGLAVAAVLMRVVVAYAPIDVPRLDEIGLNARVLAATFVITIGTGLFVGLLPALRIMGASRAELLRSSTIRIQSRTEKRLQTGLVIAEVAITTVCLAAAMLLLTSFLKLRSVDRGFGVEGIATIEVTLPASRYETREKSVRLVRAVAERLRALPGMQSVGITDRLPLRGTTTQQIAAEGADPVASRERIVGAVRAADAGYFPAIGIRLQNGRFLEDADEGRRVAVISRRTADRLWSGQDPLNRGLKIGRDAEPYQVVGIVADLRSVSLSEEPPLTIYVPLSFRLPNSASLVMKTNDSLSTLTPSVHAAIRALDRALPLAPLQTMEDVVSDSVRQRRLQLWLVVLLTAVVMLLAAIGIYSLVSQAVTRRTAEFGVRMAFGATGRTISVLVLKQALLPVGIGVVVGVLIFLMVGPAIRTLLFGVTPTEIDVLAGVVMLLLGVSVVASATPAWRASRMDPMIALRND